LPGEGVFGPIRDRVLAGMTRGTYDSKMLFSG
jgi:hypothetical protein